MWNAISRFFAYTSGAKLGNSPGGFLKRGWCPPQMTSFGLWCVCAWLGSAAYALSADAAKSTDSQTLPPSLKESWGVGPWIWGPKTWDKQTCRLWRSFEIPRGEKVKSARLRLSVDNGYRLMLNGRQIGSGSDWRSLTEYDLMQLLKPGRHVLAVEGFNDNREAGMQLGLKIELADGQRIELFSDENWRIAPPDDIQWESSRDAPSHWGRAVQVGSLLSSGGGWGKRAPTMVIKASVPPPLETHFWQSLWFQATVWIVASLSVLLCLWLAARLAVQSKAQDLLHRERARIARDVHDELGARLTELALEGEVIQTELPEGSGVAPKLEALCEKARAVSGAMDEVVWVLNSRRDTLPDFANYACKYAQRFLDASPIRCRLDVETDLPDLVLDLPTRRNLLLAVKEALNNSAKYSEATELFLRIHRQGQNLSVTVEDNGKGFDLDRTNPHRNGLTNMAARMNEIGGQCHISSKEGDGCQIEFRLPLTRRSKPIDGPEERRVQPLAGIKAATEGPTSDDTKIPAQ